MDKNKTVQLIKEILTDDKIFIHESMRKHTTFKVGGTADILVIPSDENMIMGVAKVCIQNDVPLFVIGNGSNIIVRDKGIRGVVMKIFNNYSQLKVEEDIIIAQSGALLSKVCNIALEHNLSGIEFAAGIPGTIGGAVIMNAGAYGGEMSQVVLETKYLTQNGEIKRIKGTEHNFGYRKSYFQEKKYIVLESTIKLKKSDNKSIKGIMDELSEKRRQKQPLNYPSAGSVFKRPEGYYTGKLIEDCGLKGYRIGGAQVSELHAGFIINKNNATSKDIIDLIKYIQEKVLEKFGVKIETEVKIIGEE